MQSMTKYIVLLIIFAAAVINIAQIFLLAPLIIDTFHGESFGYLHELIDKHQLKNPDKNYDDFIRKKLLCTGEI